MPKFEKGSLEMKNYMAGLRTKRGEKRPTTTNKQVSKEHIKEIMNEALEKYYMVSTPVVEVPDKVIKIDNKGDPKIIDTLTKAGNLKKVDGLNVIKLEPAQELNIKTKGKKYNENGSFKIVLTEIILASAAPCKRCTTKKQIGSVM